MSELQNELERRELDDLEVHPDDKLILEQAKEKSGRYAKDLWQLVKNHVDQLPKPEKAQYKPPKKLESSVSFKAFLLLLQAFPVMLVSAFIFSFFWDFNGKMLSVWHYEFSLQGLLRIISVSGLIGYLTNWLAITMLFKPVHRRPILGQGLVPANKERIAARLAQSVSTELINPELIRRKLEENKLISKYRERFTLYVRGVIDKPQFRDDLKLLVKEYVAELIEDKDVRGAMARRFLHQLETAVEDKQLESLALKAYRFIKGQEAEEMIQTAIAELPQKLESSLDGLDKFLDRLPRVIDENSEKLELWASQAIYSIVAQLDIHAIVEDNLNRYDEQRFEKLIRNATNEQLRYIQYLGALLGTVGGFIIWEPAPALILLSLIGGGIYLIDCVLLALKR